MLRVKKSLAECEKVLRSEFVERGRDYSAEIESVRARMENNHERRTRDKEEMERRAEELRQEEERRIEQERAQFFHQASPIPHNYFHPSYVYVSLLHYQSGFQIFGAHRCGASTGAVRHRCAPSKFFLVQHRTAPHQ